MIAGGDGKGSSSPAFSLPITPRAPVPRASRNMKTTADNYDNYVAQRQTHPRAQILTSSSEIGCVYFIFSSCNTDLFDQLTHGFSS